MTPKFRQILFSLKFTKYRKENNIHFRSANKVSFSHHKKHYDEYFSGLAFCPGYYYDPSNDPTMAVDDINIASVPSLQYYLLETSRVPVEMMAQFQKTVKINVPFFFQTTIFPTPSPAASTIGTRKIICLCTYHLHQQPEHYLAAIGKEVYKKSHRNIHFIDMSVVSLFLHDYHQWQ